MFLVLHRIVIFLYLYFLAAGYIQWAVDFRKFFVFDYFSLMVSLMLGAWYGIWLGLGWFERVYGEKSHGGLVEHLATKIFADDHEALRVKLVAAEKRLEEDVAKDVEVIDSLAQASWADAVHSRPVAKPARRKVARARARPAKPKIR